MYNSQAKNLFVSILFLCLTASTILARPMGPITGSKSSTLMARLKLDEVSQGSEPDSPNCWETLFQLQSCTSELLLFFMNGETYLADGCCNAIRAIHKDCWPSMMDTLGFTAEEGDILQGYCEGAATTNDTSTQALIVKP